MPEHFCLFFLIRIVSNYHFHINFPMVNLNTVWSMMFLCLLWYISIDDVLNFKQTFATDLDYTCLSRSIVEQCHLKCLINIGPRKIRCSELTENTIKRNYKESIKQILANDIAISFMISLKSSLLEVVLSWAISNGKTAWSFNIVFMITSDVMSYLL